MNQVISSALQPLADTSSAPLLPRAHEFHIPVMGIGFTLDTPIRTAHLGLESCLSLVNDDVVEEARRAYSQMHFIAYEPIDRSDPDCRARRITAYMNLVDQLIAHEVRSLKRTAFDDPNGIQRYFELLADSHPDRKFYEATKALPHGPERTRREEELRERVIPGEVGVNIMTKLDGQKDEKGQPRPAHGSDALAALRGFAQSTVSGALILSAGANPGLFAYLSEFEDFFPRKGAPPKKRVVLKVSDFRSAHVQGRMLSRRGIWVSEYRIESGLNCGGHAFPTDGNLLGPILREFQSRRSELREGLYAAFKKGLASRGEVPEEAPPIRITAQGGVGTASEHRLLLDEFGVDSVGWGTPFLLVPEAVRLDDATRKALTEADESKVRLSHASPLGVRFWWLTDCESEKRRRLRVEGGHSGSICTARHLALNEEFGKVPLCRGSRAYQRRKLAELDKSSPDYAYQVERITAPACICVDLCGSFFDQVGTKDAPPAAVCPGPNIVNFKESVSLERMIGHIYGRENLIMKPNRPHMLLREAQLYLDVIDEDLDAPLEAPKARTSIQLSKMLTLVEASLQSYRPLMTRLSDAERPAFEKLLNELIEEVNARQLRISLNSESSIPTAAASATASR